MRPGYGVIRRNRVTAGNNVSGSIACLYAPATEGGFPAPMGMPSFAPAHPQLLP